MTTPVSIPEPVANAASFMSAYEPPWALCGGWAVDAWLGRVTRSHGDLDITVFAEDLPILFSSMAGWYFVAHDEIEPTATELWDGRELTLPAHIHARPPGEGNRERLRQWVTPPYSTAKDGRDIEFVINELEDGHWLFEREPHLTRPLGLAIRQSPAAIPALAPEAIAYYKATAYYAHKRLWARPHDISDFEALTGILDAEQKDWLRTAIAAKHPEHEWLQELAD